MPPDLEKGSPHASLFRVEGAPAAGRALDTHPPRPNLLWLPSEFQGDFQGAIGFDVGTEDLSACGGAWTT